MAFDLDELYRILRMSHVQAQGVLDTLRDPLLVLDLDLTVVSANPAFYRAFDATRDDTIGVPFYNLGQGQWDIADLRMLLEQVIPKSTSIFDYEVTTAFPGVGERTMLLSAQRIIQPDSGRRLLLLTMVDATARRSKENHQEIMIGELHHRIKNLLAITQSLARQTRAKGRTAEEYRDAFLGRFLALGKILQVTANVDTAELPALARKVLEPYMEEGGPVALEKGPVVSLSTSQAMALGMIFHELATNALKYGALSVPDGLVTIVWTLDEEDEKAPFVKLRWRERGGPEVSAPTSNGFGTRLIDYSAHDDLGGTLEQTYDPEGLVVSLTFPLHR